MNSKVHEIKDVGDVKSRQVWDMQNVKPISRIGIGLFCTEGQKYMRWIEKSEMGIDILLCPMFGSWTRI